MTYRPIRILLLLYLILWVFEGALRKWVLPELATPLLIVRDPVALMLWIYAFLYRIFPVNPITLGAGAITLISFVFTLIVGHGNVVVALYGARVLLLHLPVIFIAGIVLDKEDVIRVGKWLLILSIPMTALLVAQYGAPASAWVNQGVGGEGTALFAGAGGKNRPPGTWSFISGPALFYPIVAAIWFGLLLDRRLPIWLLFSSGMAIILACPVSISRMLVLSCGLVGCVGLIVALRRGFIAPMHFIKVTIVGATVVVAALAIPEFSEASDAFMARWKTSTTDRGGLENAIVGRMLSDVVWPFTSFGEVPVWGHGLGLGTQAGVRIHTGSRGFLLGEGEWPRLINELGPILGLGFIAIRSILVFQLGLISLACLGRGNGLALLLCSSCAYNLLSGQWGQSTTLGAAIIGAGLTLASMKETYEETSPGETTREF